MLVQKDRYGEEVAEIRYSLKRAGRFAGARYTLRYFQSEGKGMLRLDKGAALKPNLLSLREGGVSLVLQLVVGRPPNDRCLYRRQLRQGATTDIFIQSQEGRVD